MLHLLSYMLQLLVLVYASQEQNSIEIRTYVEVAKADYYKITPNTKPVKIGSIEKLNPTQLYNINDKIIWNKNLIRPFEYSITIADESIPNEGYILIEMKDKKDQTRLYARKENNTSSNWQLYHCSQKEPKSKSIAEITDIDAFLKQQIKFPTTEKSLSKSDEYKKKQFAFSKSCDTLMGKLRPIYIELVKIEKKYVFESNKAKLGPSYSCAKTVFEYIDSLLLARAKYHVTSMTCFNHEPAIKAFDIERLNKLFELLKAKISKAASNTEETDLDTINKIFTQLSSLEDSFKDLNIWENQLRNFIITSRSKDGKSPSFVEIFDEKENIYIEAATDFQPILEEYKKLIRIRSKRTYNTLFTIDTISNDDVLKGLFLIRKYHLALRYIEYSECLKTKSNTMDIGYFADSYAFKNIVTRELVADLENEIKRLTEKGESEKSKGDPSKTSTGTSEEQIKIYEKLLKDAQDLIKKHNLLFGGMSSVAESKNEPTIEPSQQVQTEETPESPMAPEAVPIEDKEEEQKPEKPVVETEPTVVEPNQDENKADKTENGSGYYTKLSIIVILVIVVLCVVGGLIYTYTKK